MKPKKSSYLKSKKSYATIMLKVLHLKDWRPLSRTKGLDRLLGNISNAQAESLLKEFMQYLLMFYKAKVKWCIKYQKFPVPYKPLSESYMREKINKGWNTGFWIRTGFLVDNLTFWYVKYKKYYVIGFPPHIVEPDTGYPVAEIAKNLEFGTKDGKIPPRPLFTPIAASINRHILDTHFRKFLKEFYPNLYTYL